MINIVRIGKVIFKVKLLLLFKIKYIIFLKNRNYKMDSSLNVNLCLKFFFI